MVTLLAISSRGSGLLVPSATNPISSIVRTLKNIVMGYIVKPVRFMASATLKAAMNKSSNGCFPKLSHLTVVVEARAFSARKSRGAKLMAR